MCNVALNENSDTPKTVSQIFKLCKDDVQKVADYNAAQASQAVDNAGDEILLLAENGDLKQLQ